MFALGHVFNVCKYAFAFTSCLQKASGCATSKGIGPSTVILEHAHSLARVCVHLDPQEYVGAFQNPLWVAHFSDFPGQFFGKPFTCFSTLDLCDCK